MDDICCLRVALDGPVSSVEYEVELAPGTDLWIGGAAPLRFGDRNIQWRLSFYEDHSWYLHFRDSWVLAAVLPGSSGELDAMGMASIARPVEGGFVIGIEVGSYVRVLVGGCWLSIFVVLVVDEGKTRVVVRDCGPENCLGKSHCD